MVFSSKTSVLVLLTSYLLAWITCCSFGFWGCEGLAASARRRRKRQQRSTATATVVPSRWTRTTTDKEASHTNPSNSDDDDDVSLEVLWGMAGRTSRRKRQRGRQTFLEDVDDNFETTKAEGPMVPSKRRKASLLDDDEGSLIRSDELSDITLQIQESNGLHLLQATVLLKNGTSMVVQDTRNLHQRRDKAVWMAIRKQLNVTASETSAILGNSVFSDRQALLTKKIKQNQTPLGEEEKKKFVGNLKACEWGLKMEPKALRQYIQVTGNKVNETGLHASTLESAENSMPILMGASPDGMIVDAKDGTTGVLEIKCLWGRRNKKELPQFDHCPQRFWDQIQTQMQVCDVDWCDLMLYIPPSSAAQQRGSGKSKNRCILRIPRDRTYWQQTIQPAVQEFCRDVANGVSLAGVDEDVVQQTPSGERTSRQVL